MPDKGHIKETRIAKNTPFSQESDAFVLEKSIFSNIFEKDIRRVFIYKKAERLAKAIHLITPAFAGSTSLKDKLDAIAVGLVEAAILPPGGAREAFSRELLSLSSILAIARSGGLLSPMNAGLITSEAHALLAEVASYEEPRLFLDDSPTLAELAKHAGKVVRDGSEPRAEARIEPEQVKGHVSDTPTDKGRSDAILSVIRSKGTVYIKDISTVIRDVSEKTIQRELKRLVSEGVLTRTGNRRWTAYTLAPLG